jgi:hypothetical protein
MKKIDLIILRNFIVDLINKNEKYPKMFSNALYRNETILSPIVTDYNKNKSPLTDDMKEVEQKRIELINKYSEKDEVNEQGNKFVKKNITIFIEEYNKIINENEKYKLAIEEITKNDKEFNDFLNTDVTEKLNLIKISITEFPNNVEPQIFYMLKEIIKD